MDGAGLARSGVFRARLAMVALARGIRALGGRWCKNRCRSAPEALDGFVHRRLFLRRFRLCDQRDLHRRHSRQTAGAGGQGRLGLGDRGACRGAVELCMGSAGAQHGRPPGLAAGVRAADRLHHPARDDAQSAAESAQRRAVRRHVRGHRQSHAHADRPQLSRQPRQGHGPADFELRRGANCRPGNGRFDCRANGELPRRAGHHSSGDARGHGAFTGNAARHRTASAAELIRPRQAARACIARCLLPPWRSDGCSPPRANG